MARFPKVAVSLLVAAPIYLPDAEEDHLHLHPHLPAGLTLASLSLDQRQSQSRPRSAPETGQRPRYHRTRIGTSPFGGNDWLCDCLTSAQNIRMSFATPLITPRTIMFLRRPFRMLLRIQ